VDYVARIGGVRILALASLFVVGRVLYAIGYLLASVVKISTLRSLGFAINLIVNIILVTHHLGFEVFDIIDRQIVPLAKGFIL